MPKKIFVVIMKGKSLVMMRRLMKMKYLVMTDIKCLMMVRLHLEGVVVPSHRFAPVGRVTKL